MRTQWIMAAWLLATPAAAQLSPLPGTPIEPDATVTIDVPDSGGQRAVEGQHFQALHVHEGQRLPLPHAADGSCITDVTIGVSGSPVTPPVEFSGDGHFLQHDIQQQVATMIDETTCELVVSTIQATDVVKRKRLRTHPPHEAEYLNAHPNPIPELTPAPGPLSRGREYENPQVLYRWYSRAKSTLIYIAPNGAWVPKIYSWQDMTYHDQPSRRILSFRVTRELSNSVTPYWISAQSSTDQYRPWEPPFYGLGSINNTLGAGIGWSGALRAGVIAWPYDDHYEDCWATRPYGPFKVTICQTRHYLLTAFLN